MTNIVILFCKAMGYICKVLGRGTSLPGYLALRMKPSILTDLKYPQDIVFVTGTNGETTVVCEGGQGQYLYEVLKEKGLKSRMGGEQEQREKKKYVMTSYSEMSTMRKKYGKKS